MKEKKEEKKKNRRGKRSYMYVLHVISQSRQSEVDVLICKRNRAVSTQLYNTQACKSPDSLSVS